MAHEDEPDPQGAPKLSPKLVPTVVEPTPPPDPWAEVSPLEADAESREPDREERLVVRVPADLGVGPPADPDSIMVERKRTAVRTVEHRRPKPPESDAPASADRRYPKMLAHLRSPERFEVSGRPRSRSAPVPVPGTFFPAPKERPVQPKVADLDELLSTMAEGLLIGSSADGGTEVRVTLRDEFFQGTELRISVTEGRVCARLLPPDRDVYLQLEAYSDDLRRRLDDRGLTVAEIVVEKP